MRLLPTQERGGGGRVRSEARLWSGQRWPAEGWVPCTNPVVETNLFDVAER
jgi:hypothetical protein